MIITVKGRLNDRDFMTAREIVQGARAVVRAVSFAVERAVKLAMPVDTGRARASWGHWTPGTIRNNPHASPGDAVWETSEGGLSITQGSNVEYIEDLNAGSSRKAPAGFIDAAAEKGMRELDRQIDDLLRGL